MTDLLNSEWLLPAIGAAGSALLLKPIGQWLLTLPTMASNRRLTLEQEVALLRVAFDKSRRRESGYASACDLLIAALEVTEEDRPLLVKRAREVLVECLKREQSG